MYCSVYHGKHHRVKYVSLLCRTFGTHHLSVERTVFVKQSRTAKNNIGTTYVYIFLVYIFELTTDRSALLDISGVSWKVSSTYTVIYGHIIIYLVQSTPCVNHASVLWVFWYIRNVRFFSALEFVWCFIAPEFLFCRRAHSLVFIPTSYGRLPMLWRTRNVEWWSKGASVVSTIS